jgi:hypothetical protein
MVVKLSRVPNGLEPELRKVDCVREYLGLHRERSMLKKNYNENVLVNLFSMENCFGRIILSRNPSGVM